MTTSSYCSTPTNAMTNIQTKSISSTRIETTPIPSDMCNMDLKINKQKCDVVMSENQKKVCENNVTVENSKSEIIILDTDPYAELELYLEKVKVCGIFFYFKFFIIPPFLQMQLNCLFR